MRVSPSGSGGKRPVFSRRRGSGCFRRDPQGKTGTGRLFVRCFGGRPESMGRFSQGERRRVFYRSPAAGLPRRRARCDDVSVGPFVPVRDDLWRCIGTKASVRPPFRKTDRSDVGAYFVGRSVSAVLPFRGRGSECRMFAGRSVLCLFRMSVFRKVKRKSGHSCLLSQGGGLAVALADCGDRAVSACLCIVAAFSAHRTGDKGAIPPAGRRD